MKYIRSQRMSEDAVKSLLDQGFVVEIDSARLDVNGYKLYAVFVNEL